jgi:hypothetical protein
VTEIRNLPYEVAYELGPRGGIRRKKSDGYESSVTWELHEIPRLRGVYLLHNHPDNQGLSDNDIKHMFRCQLRGVIAVGQERTYVLENLDWHVSWLDTWGRACILKEAHEQYWEPRYARLSQQGWGPGYRRLESGSVYRQPGYLDIPHEAVVSLQQLPEWGNLRYEMREE